jgi:addiction module HigA family antidote
MVLIPTDAAPPHPGEALREDFLPELGWTQQQLAERLGISFRRVNEILNEKRPVTLDTALRLGRLFGQSAAFWMNLQLAWDLYQAERGEVARTVAAEVEPFVPA